MCVARINCCATHMEKLTTKTLKPAAKRAGYTVKALAAKIGRNRSTVHLAVRYPERYGPTFRAVVVLLNQTAGNKGIHVF